MTAGEPGQARAPLSFRRACPGDAAPFARLTEQLGYPAAVGDLAARLEATLAREDHAVFAADLDGEVVGWIHVLVALRVESPPFAEIAGLVVAASARRQGIGQGLVAAARSWTRGRGLRTMRVRTNILRQDAQAFYHRLGFELLKNQAVFSLPLPAPGPEKAPHQSAP